MKAPVHRDLARTPVPLIQNLAALFISVTCAYGIIGPQFQMQLGNPSGALADTNNHSHYLIVRSVEALDYSDVLGEPNWVSWDLTAGDIGSSGRSPEFYTDTTLPIGFYEVTSADYSGSGYDRGHMCPSADRTDNDADNALVFLMSNIIPQAANNNQGVWADFEIYCRSLAEAGNELLLLCGPSGFNGSRIQPSGKAAIPAYTWKIAVVVPPGTGNAPSRITEATRVISLKIPNSNSVGSTWQNYVTSPAEIEADTGFSFFTALSSNLAAVLRAKVDGQSFRPDLRVLVNHGGTFTQGETGAVYTITVANAGDSASAGQVSVVDTLPAGLTAVTASGSGWAADLSTLTFTRSDSLTAGASYPPISLTVSISSTTEGVVTNNVVVSGGGDTQPSNNTSYDVAIISSGSGGGSTNSVVLAGWDVSTLSGGADNFGPSPLPPTVIASNLFVGGLTRGAGVGTYGTGATRAWGGNDFTSSGSSAAVAAQQFVTFVVGPSNGYSASFKALSFDYRHSGTGPAHGLLQYQLGSGAFADITSLSYPVSTSAGGSIPPIDLSVIPELQSLGSGTNVTFRLVNWGGTSTNGTWYVFDTSNSLSMDFVLEGVVSPAGMLTPIQAWRLNWFGTTENQGAAADSAVTANDGLANLVKYALGLNPFVPADNPLIVDISSGYLQATVPKNPDAVDVSFRFESTPDLAGYWTTNGIVVDQNTPTLWQVHDAAPLTASPATFMRLRISRP